MASDSFQEETPQTQEEAFPSVDPECVPLGNRVMVQIRRTAAKTRSGIVLVAETKETVKWNGQVARVHALGPIAFRNRETAKPWPEGMWAEPGDYVRVPRWGGDRIEVSVKDSEPVVFVCFQDHEIISKVMGNPLTMKTYIL